LKIKQTDKKITGLNDKWDLDKMLWLNEKK
jgi:hypothetical protein